ncbi:MAG TPA: hypothetical protein PLU22_22280, partial [Polyangiaceae bacterium]|nr:hypothetical protein [Polyangiaceae bacterium]
MTSAAPSTPRRRRRGPLVLGCLGAFLATGVVIVLIGVLLLARFWDPYLRRRVREAALGKGFAIEFVAIHASCNRLELEGVTLTLVGVEGIAARLDRIELALDHLEPVAATVHGGRIGLAGSAPALALALAEWTRAHPATYAVPLTADGIGVEWREAATAEPWLTLAGGTVVPNPVGGACAADRAAIGGVDVGRVTAGYRSTEAQIELGFGAQPPAEGPVRIVVRHAATPPVATVTLRPTPLERLARPLGVPLPVSGVTASGAAELALPESLGVGPVTGTLRLVLQGYIPPHPAELDGFGEPADGDDDTTGTGADEESARSDCRCSHAAARARADTTASASGMIARPGADGPPVIAALAPVGASALRASSSALRRARRPPA